MSQRSGEEAERHWQQGQGLLEYAFIILLVVLVVFGGLILVGPAIANIFHQISPAL